MKECFDSSVVSPIARAWDSEDFWGRVVVLGVHPVVAKLAQGVDVTYLPCGQGSCYKCQ